MARLMTFAKTARQFETGQKDMTRRMGWKSLEPGDLIEGIEWAPRVGPRWACASKTPCGWFGGTKVGARPEGGRCPECGGPVEVREPRRLGLRRVVRAWSESLSEMHPDHVAREGFPGMGVREFLDMFCVANRVATWMDVTVITFRGLDRGTSYERTEHRPPWWMCPCEACRSLRPVRADARDQSRPSHPKCKYVNREKVLADAWEEENLPRPGLNGGFGVLDALLRDSQSPGTHILGPDGFVPTDRERVVAATAIQWLGSNVGFSFLREALREMGYRIVDEDGVSQ